MLSSILISFLWLQAKEPRDPGCHGLKMRSHNTEGARAFASLLGGEPSTAKEPLLQLFLCGTAGQRSGTVIAAAPAAAVAWVGSLVQELPHAAGAPQKNVKGIGQHMKSGCQVRMHDRKNLVTVANSICK